GAMDWVTKCINKLVDRPGKHAAHRAAARDVDKLPKNQYSQQYMFVRLEGADIEELVQMDRKHSEDIQKKRAKEQARNPGSAIISPIGPKAIYHIWPDFPIRGLLNKSISTVKGDAAHASYAAFGKDIVWAVMDSGIDGTHKHFKTHDNLTLTKPLKHMDFSGAGAGEGNPLHDGKGHGTHVAGIIAGIWPPEGPAPGAYNRRRDERDEVSYTKVDVRRISGIAPQAKLVSLKVMDDEGNGEASNLIAAIAMIQEINGYGRRLLIHGVNMSVGYEFEPEWFACGQSPLCVEINRLVRSGVSVVVAAGNTGYGSAQSQFNGIVSAGMGLTINDPGNADLAITVGATHRDSPHVYGVSYFSSKGPTGDGRAKPDLVAPGEKILSCAAGTQLAEMKAKKLSCDYLEESGTSMAAPHVSGAIAAFLSIRREFVGEPEKVKEIFMSTATDLKRERYFQGTGLVDLMRAIQSV
ncbi:MAG: peptidase in kexin sedolisin, partial [Hymenobacter sp.]|nr:peptidase in kexin sedolisin [Hymenobacter sp.]